MELGEYDHQAVEAAARTLWESHDIYRYERDGLGPVFSVDTPPPYVSASHLHVGHAMSYSQPDFIVRYRRMSGERVFYPIGFDDNGLPTERYVEQAYGVRAADMPRAEFVALCLAGTRRTAERYEDLWRRLAGPGGRGGPGADEQAVHDQVPHRPPQPPSRRTGAADRHDPARALAGLRGALPPSRRSRVQRAEPSDQGAGAAVRLRGTRARRRGGATTCRCVWW